MCCTRSRSGDQAVWRAVQYAMRFAASSTLTAAHLFFFLHIMETDHCGQLYAYYRTWHAVTISYTGQSRAGS